MKSADFFTLKAEFFLVELSSIELVPVPWKYHKDDFYEESLEKWNEDFFTLMCELKHIKYQMEAMFSDCDRGDYFLAKLNDFIPETEDVNKYYLHYLIKINEMFIEFLLDNKAEQY